MVDNASSKKKYVIHTMSVYKQSNKLIIDHIYQHPPLGQDMTQGQFLSRV